MTCRRKAVLPAGAAEEVDEFEDKFHEAHLLYERLCWGTTEHPDRWVRFASCNVARSAGS
jgi:hypothetical protein